MASRELLSPVGEAVRLTTGEFDLLAAFVDNANQVLSRDRLLDLARNREAGPFDRTIDVQVGRLRRKLEDDPQNPSLIKTVRGSGYIFTPAGRTQAEDCPRVRADRHSRENAAQSPAAGGWRAAPPRHGGGAAPRADGASSRSGSGRRRARRCRSEENPGRAAWCRKSRPRPAARPRNWHPIVRSKGALRMLDRMMQPMIVRPDQERLAEPPRASRTLVWDRLLTSRKAIDHQRVLLRRHPDQQRDRAGPHRGQHVVEQIASQIVCPDSVIWRWIIGGRLCNAHHHGRRCCSPVAPVFSKVSSTTSARRKRLRTARRAAPWRGISFTDGRRNITS